VILDYSVGLDVDRCLFLAAPCRSWPGLVEVLDLFHPDYSDRDVKVTPSTPPVGVVIKKWANLYLHSLCTA
jgi:hypothetical protein